MSRKRSSSDARACSSRDTPIPASTRSYEAGKRSSSRSPSVDRALGFAATYPREPRQGEPQGQRGHNNSEPDGRPDDCGDEGGGEGSRDGEATRTLEQPVDHGRDPMRPLSAGSLRAAILRPEDPWDEPRLVLRPTQPDAGVVRPVDAFCRERSRRCLRKHFRQRKEELK
jgi:hypothetical protein